MQGWKDFLLALGKKLTPILAFVVLLVLVFAWYGDKISSMFQALMYVVVIGGMLIYSLQEILRHREYLRQMDKSFEPHPPEPALPDPEAKPKELPQPSETKPPVPESSAAAPVDQELALHQYLTAVISECTSLRLASFDPEAAEPGRRRLTLDSGLHSSGYTDAG